MKNQKILCFCLFLTAVLVLPASVQAQKQKVKVTLHNASIKIEPKLGSEVLKNPKVGDIFDVEKREGEWFEIVFPSKDGVMITGYIHEMFVELIDMPPVVERRIDRAPLRKPTYQRPPSAFAEPEIFTRFYIFGNLGLPVYSTTPESVSWSDDWSFRWLNNVSERGSIDLENKLKKPGFGAGIILMLTRNIGVEARMDMVGGDVTTDSDYSLEWTWSSAVGGGTYEGDIDPYSSGTGSLSIIPFSFNLYIKFPVNPMIVPHISAGASLFTGKFSADATMGDAGSWYYTIFPFTYQEIDWFEYQYEIPEESISGLGFNAGGGLTIQVARNIGLDIDARYFMGPKKEFVWTLVRRTYESLSEGYEASDTRLDNHEELMQETPITISMGFFSITFGIIIGF